MCALSVIGIVKANASAYFPLRVNIQIPDDVSFLLLGAPNTYADREYLVEAQPMFCSPNNAYLIRWSVQPELPPDAPSFARVPGVVMRIPGGQLLTGSTYTIEATLLRANDSQAIVVVSIAVAP